MASKTKATRTVKPKCNATPCGFTCISSKYVCSSRILKRDVDALVKAAVQVSQLKPTSLPSLSPTLADNDGKSTWRQQLDKAFTRLTDAVADMTGLSSAEAISGTKALQNYVGGGYANIRMADAGTPLSMQDIDHASSINALVSKLPSHQGSLYRGLSFNSQSKLDDFIKDTSTGFTLTSMSSFSSRLSVAESFTSNYSAILSLKTNKSGKAISAFNKDVSESEVLVLKTATYKTLSISKDSKGNTVIDLEEV